MIDPEKPVRVIRNWRHDCYTILQNGRPLASAKQVRLADVEFLVRDSGRSRMLRDKKRNVHAYAIGTLVDYTHPDDQRNIRRMSGREIAYNPYRTGSFVDVESAQPVTNASMAHFYEGGVAYAA